MEKVKCFEDRARELGISRDWVEGLKHGLEIAKAVALTQGYELTFPGLDELEITKVMKDGVSKI